MKSSLEEIRVKPQYALKLELTQEELHSFYLVLHHTVDPYIKGQLSMSDEDFAKVEKINSEVFNAVRDAVMKSNEYWEEDNYGK